VPVDFVFLNRRKAKNAIVCAARRESETNLPSSKIIQRSILMVCNHLKELYELCESHNLRMGGADMIRIVCKTCNEHEVCPSMLMDEYDARYLPEVEVPLRVEPRVDPKSTGM
jgi:hypothetical protein